MSNQPLASNHNVHSSNLRWNPFTPSDQDHLKATFYASYDKSLTWLFEQQHRAKVHERHLRQRHQQRDHLELRQRNQQQEHHHQRTKQPLGPFRATTNRPPSPAPANASRVSDSALSAALSPQRITASVLPTLSQSQSTIPASLSPLPSRRRLIESSSSYNTARSSADGKPAPQPFSQSSLFSSFSATTVNDAIHPQSHGRESPSRSPQVVSEQTSSTSPTGSSVPLTARAQILGSAVSRSPPLNRSTALGQGSPMPPKPSFNEFEVKSGVGLRSADANAVDEAPSLAVHPVSHQPPKNLRSTPSSGMGPPLGVEFASSDSQLSAPTAPRHVPLFGNDLTSSQQGHRPPASSQAAGEADTRLRIGAVAQDKSDAFKRLEAVVKEKRRSLPQGTTTVSSDVSGPASEQLSTGEREREPNQLQQLAVANGTLTTSSVRSPPKRPHESTADGPSSKRLRVEDPHSKHGRLVPTTRAPPTTAAATAPSTGAQTRAPPAIATVATTSQQLASAKATTAKPSTASRLGFLGKQASTDATKRPGGLPRPGLSALAVASLGVGLTRATPLMSTTIPPPAPPRAVVTAPRFQTPASTNPAPKVANALAKAEIKPVSRLAMPPSTIARTPAAKVLASVPPPPAADTKTPGPSSMAPPPAPTTKTTPAAPASRNPPAATPTHQAQREFQGIRSLFTPQHTPSASASAPGPSTLYSPATLTRGVDIFEGAEWDDFHQRTIPEWSRTPNLKGQVEKQTAADGERVFGSTVNRFNVDKVFAPKTRAMEPVLRKVRLERSMPPVSEEERVAYEAWVFEREAWKKVGKGGGMQNGKGKGG